MSGPIKYINLDFFQQKDDLKEFLRGQSQYSDYDFEGSNFSIFLDTLSYYMSHNSFYTNFALNESFIDTAQQRGSVVSLAKALGYTPTSTLGARAIIDLWVSSSVSGRTSPLIIDKNTKFTTVVDSITYTFVTEETVTSSTKETIDGVEYFFFDNVSIKEGTPTTYQKVINNAQTLESDIGLTSQFEVPKIEIPNANIDTSTLTVTVKESSVNKSYIYTKAADVNYIISSDRVYWVNENKNGLYEIHFGDGNIGKAISHGDIVTLSYLVSSGSSPNKASTFSLADNIGSSVEGIIITTVSAAAGGDEKEDIESVRFAAPKNFEAQNRAVTAEDYKSILLRDYPRIDSISVWGGEDASPQQFGKVFISIKPTDGFSITDEEKNTITKTILDKRNVVTITPELVDPDYTFIEINTNIKYDPNGTFKKASELRADVISAIQEFNTNNLGKFESIFRLSKLMTKIDSVNSAIKSNYTTVTLKKEWVPENTTSNLISTRIAKKEFIFNKGFNLPYSGYLGAITSSQFSYTYVDSTTNNCLLKDDGLGNLKMYTVNQLTGAESEVLNNGVSPVDAIIDYTNGTITINSILGTLSNYGTAIDIRVDPIDSNLKPIRNQLVSIQSDDITVTIEQE